LHALSCVTRITALDWISPILVPRRRWKVAFCQICLRLTRRGGQQAATRNADTLVGSTSDQSKEGTVMTEIPTVSAAVAGRREGVDRTTLTAVVVGTAALVCILLYGIVTPRSAAVSSAASDEAIVFGP
jgi:hypothetical protein